MKNGKKRQAFALRFLKVLFVLSCLGGFLYQTSDFLLLYWTYPTVVGIQETDPPQIEIPAFTICNSIGYNYTHMCRPKSRSLCMPADEEPRLCELYPNFCIDGSAPKDLQFADPEFMLLYELTQKDHDILRVKLEDFMECRIEIAGEESKCDMEHVMGPFFTTDDILQYCYAIYSKWGQPERKKTFLPKGATMNFHFVLNSTQRADPEDRRPLFVLTNNPSVQIAVHSPYFLPSPHVDGLSYIGGKAYDLRFKMSERHLLPAPYETNCTDYMKNWTARGGRGPVNQMGIVQECRVNRTYEAYGCVPFTLNYPHTLKLCRTWCDEGVCNISTFSKECGNLVDSYMQPCDSITYTATREERINKTFEPLPGTTYIEPEFDCKGLGYWTQRCATIDVQVLFDQFEITNLTYHPKFESLELFSVIGGYMGIWLGISLLNMYDFAGLVIVMIKAYNERKRVERKLEKEKNHSPHAENYNYKRRSHAKTRSDRGPRRQEVW